MSILRAPKRVVSILAGVFVLSSLNCGREASGPVATTGSVFRKFASLAVDPQFEAALARPELKAALGQVAFEKVHIVIRREDHTIALDTTVNFPADAESLTLALLVPLPGNAPATGVPMTLDMDYLNAAGLVVFHGSLSLNVVPSTVVGTPPPPVQIPLQYTGPGAKAASLQIAPASATGLAGAVVQFSAVAVDDAGAVLPGTPIVFSSSDATVATINAATGAATLGQKRGTARITAQTLTGQSTSATLTVTLPGSVLTATGGGTADVRTALPVTAKVTASDGVPVSGVAVTFAVATGDGSVAPASATTDASGNATSTWTLGATPGAQSLTVSAVGATRTLSATALALKATKISVGAGPAGQKVGQAFSLGAQAQDATGAVVKDYAGTLTVALGSNPSGAGLGGTTSAVVSNGAVTFSGLSISKAGKGFTLVVSGGDLTPGTSSAFDVAGPPATQLAFTVVPGGGVKAGVNFSVAVAAQDATGAVVTDFTEAISLRPSGGTGTLRGTASRSAAAGVATFDNLNLDRPGSYTLTASAGTLTSATASITILVGDPTTFQGIRGLNQTGPAGSSLSEVVVRLRDAGGNGVNGRNVKYVVRAGGGSVSPATAITDAAGDAHVLWTLGALVGEQVLAATYPGIPDYEVRATATKPPPGTMTVKTGDNQFTAGNASVLTLPSVLLKNGANLPVSGVAVTFTPSAGSSITGPATITTGTDGVAIVGGWTLGASGSFTLTASAAGYNSIVFKGTVNTVPMSVTSAEKLPNGTQQFSVTGGNLGDTYTWTVNNIVGGNSTFGTISTSGFYTAPATVPTPASFPVCAQSVQTPANKGCVTVTVTTTPTAGGELIVINDVNWSDNYYGTPQYDGVYSNPGNVQFIKNLVNFMPTGARRTATKIMNMQDSRCCEDHSFTGQESGAAAIYLSQGYTPVQSTSHADLLAIPADVKVVLLVNPRSSFMNAEVNGLKTFASQGGRIVFIGEHSGYYGCCIASVENDFMTKMGAQMTNVGASISGYTNTVYSGHQLTNGVSDFHMSAVSYISPGPNDFVLMRETSSNLVTAAVAKIDYTLLPILPSLRALSALENSPTPAQPAYTSDGRLRNP